MIGVRCRAVSVATALVLAACAVEVPPPPGTPLAEGQSANAAFDGAGNAAFSELAPEDAWWRLYDDPVIDRLVTEALTANLDLQVADANLRRATAAIREVAVGQEISTTASGGVALARPSGSTRDLPGSFSYNIGLSAGYLLDLSDKVQNAIAATVSDAEAVRAARDGVRVAVAAGVTRAYARVCAANHNLAVNRKVVALLENTLDATRRRVDAGRGTAFDVTRAQAAVDNARTLLPPFEAQRQANLYALAALIGRPARDYPREAEVCADLPQLGQPLPVGDGAALLRRRPDIRAAERSLAAASARIAVATADLYPQVTLGGSVGLAGPLSDVGKGSSFGVSLGPLVSWSFPNKNAARARIEGASAQAAAGLARFDGTVLAALREVETALAQYSHDRERMDALVRATASAATASDQADQLYRFGRVDFLAVLDAQHNLAVAEAARAAAEAGLVDDQISVFQALGGGWQTGNQDAP